MPLIINIDFGNSAITASVIRTKSVGRYRIHLKRYHIHSDFFQSNEVNRDKIR